MPNKSGTPARQVTFFCQVELVQGPRHPSVLREPARAQLCTGVGVHRVGWKASEDLEKRFGSGGDTGERGTPDGRE